MAYKALYNKYRPQTFEEVAGQRAIVRTLRNAISTDKIAHAYLFCGPRGTGKTSMARLFAKALNCEEGAGHQCNHCSNCEALNNGSHPDVMEIDAASNNGVDQVRDLIEKVRYSPIKGRYKIYIIDEVHMMSQGAFNALLKTLEEPPDHVIFILATTEPHKVIPTILSRCQRYDFAKIDESDIKEKLLWILNKEGVSYDEEGLNDVVSLADGGMRDALSILDQVLAYGGNALREEDVLSVFGLTSAAEKAKLLNTIVTGDVAGVLLKLEAFLSSGVDIKRLCGDLLDILKDLIIYQRTGAPDLMDVLKEESARPLAECISPKQANAMIDILLKAQIDFKAVSNIRSLFELTLLQLCNLFNAPEEVEIAPKSHISPVSKPQKVEPVVEITKPEPIPAPVVEEAKPEPKPEPQPQKKQPNYDPSSGVPYLGTTAPDFLLEDDNDIQVEPVKPLEAPKPVIEPKKVEQAPEPVRTAPTLDLSGLTQSNVSEEGTPNVIDDETIVKIMVLGTKFKAERKSLFDRWPTLEPYTLDARSAEFANLLYEAKPFCLTEEVILLNYNHPRQKRLANYQENQEGLSEMLAVLLGRRVFVYALDRDDSHRTQTLFYNYQQLGKLPVASSIELNLPKGGK